MLYRAESEISSTIASLSDKLQLKVLPHLRLLRVRCQFTPLADITAGRPNAYSQAVRMHFDNHLLIPTHAVTGLYLALSSLL